MIFAVTAVLVLCVAVNAVFWLTFALRYTGYGHVLGARRRPLLWLLPGVLGVLSPLGFVFPLYDFAVGRSLLPSPELVFDVYTATTDLLFPVVFLYALFALAIGAGLLGRTTVAYEHLDASLGGLLVAAMICPYVVLILFTFDAVPGTNPELSLLVTVSLVTAPALFVAVSRFDPFDVTPAVRTGGNEIVVSEIDDPVLVTDNEGTIVDLNPAARQQFVGEDETVVGWSLDALLDSSVSDVDALDAIELDAPGGRRYYDVGVSDVTDQHGTAVGHVLVLTDITDQRAREQRLEVLNRVIRHNLRNDMSAILSRAQLLSRQEETEDLAAPIADIARDLSETGGKARTAEQLMNRSQPSDPQTDLASLVTDVVETVSETYRDVDVTVSIPDLTVGADSEILRPVVEELVENACEHNDAADPSVRVTATRSDDESRPIALSVTDNGPGIPAQERETVLSESESALHHASGLGLWLVKWGVTRLRGTVEFSTRDPRGTTVTVRLPTPEQAATVAGATVEMTADNRSDDSADRNRFDTGR